VLRPGILYPYKRTNQITPEIRARGYRHRPFGSFFSTKLRPRVPMSKWLSVDLDWEVRISESESGRAEKPYFTWSEIH
jgi:hypothetical protein